MAVVTISRQFSSNGDEICQKLAEKIGYKLVGKKVLRQKMIEFGCSEEIIDKFDGRKPSFFNFFSRGKDEYLYYLKTAIFSEAEKGNCIIVGRGGFSVLKEIENCVSFKIIETRTLRADRLMKKYPELTEKFALKVVKKADWHQLGFYKSFFDFKIKDHFIFDAILNTSNADSEVFVNTICEFLKSKITPENEKNGTQKIEQLLLGQNLVNMLNFGYGVKIDNLKIDVCDNNLILHGVASSTAEVDNVIKILSLEMSNFEIESKIRIVQDYM